MNWKKYPAAVLLVLLAMHILAQVDRNVLLGFSPQVTRELAIGNAQYGFLVGPVWVLSYGFMAMFMGTLADRFSRTRVIAAGVMIWSVCTVASGYAQNFEQMVAARFLVASGEAALVPAAVALLADLFPPHRRGTAISIFFMGIPLGIGVSFLLAGTVGASHGWRETFHWLGIVGLLIAVPLSFLTEDRSKLAAHEKGAPFLPQMQAVWSAVRSVPALRMTIVGFVMVNMMFPSLAFTQIWLVNERGLDAAGMATRIGALQLVFGTLGALIGGGLGDRFARKFKSGHGGFMALLIAVCAPLMIAYRFAPAGSLLFYLGMCAGFFMPLAVYGPATTLIQGLVQPSMRSSIIGFSMLLLNIFAVAIASLAVGAIRDYLAANGTVAPFTKVLLTTDMLAISASLFFALAARRVQGLQLACLGRVN
ncbi:MFS transporter [Paraburkholderia sp. BL10I2N1]|uniref:MFS transporter n=1 Tax=Paraburkholderia sp. BL10I2N1 TaxID=1938796 RepID=UPI0010621CF1|nr:MFS transporter [Paraburkholderia sp. BL10I2N1]TDN58672.1 sugar phosphate permease [Paraburkholderia sp. BL10I2N1]